MRKHLCHVYHVPCTQNKNGIVFGCDTFNKELCLLKGGAVVRINANLLCKSRQILRRDALNWLFPRGIDGQVNNSYTAKTGVKMFPKGLCAGECVRLKYAYNLALCDALRRLDGGGNFRWMMRVVAHKFASVVHFCPAPFHSAKTAKSVANL